MRLRTLPLSLAGIIMGVSLAWNTMIVEADTVVWLVLTTAMLQILSNLSNELGDTLQGTDTANRQGIHYAIQDGMLTIADMKRLIAAAVVLCCVFGTLMIWTSFGTLWDVEPILFLVLGAAAIVAAMRYTLGKNPYGYRGKGDFYVFIFFGLVSTLGAYYMCCHRIEIVVALPAAAIGCFSMGVLNVNNIRDMKTDAATRTTVALKLGLHRARVYQSILIITGWLLLGGYSLLTATTWKEWLYWMMLPLFVLHLKGIWTREDRALDPMLPLLVMSTFALTFCVFLVKL